MLDTDWCFAVRCHASLLQPYCTAAGFDNRTSIFGDGIGGAHGGSGLSSIGGSIRLGELLPGAPPIPHALKIELGNWWYYGGSQLNPNTADNGGRNLCARVWAHCNPCPSSYSWF